MEVDRALVHGGVRGARVDRAEQPPGALLHDLHRPSALAADVGEVGGALPACPVPGPGPAPQQTGGFQLGHQLRAGGTEERQVVLGQGQFRGGGAQVRGEDVGVVGVEDGGLDGLVEQGLGVVDEEGVQRVVAGDQHREGALSCAARPAGLLPQRGAGARVAAAIRTASRPETSMPSSRAVVAARPRSSPECRARSRARRSSGR